MEFEPLLYSTNREKEFIDKIGSFGTDEKNGLNKMGRKELLRNYLLAADMRVNWGNIDKDKVMDHVVQKLRAGRKHIKEIA